jgi:spore maturation protein CgeB
VLLRLKERSAAKLVHYTPDAQLIDNRSRHFDDCIPLYDILVTTKPFEISLYQSAGAREVMFLLQGYDNRFAPIVPTADIQTELGSEVCFIGHFQRHYACRLRTASRAVGRLRIWGPGWVRYARFHPWARPHVVADGIWGGRYPLALACSKIALGLLSKRIPETTTTRTFEIPAMGIFMLAERTDDHSALFREGVEAEFFSGDDELHEKISFYLRNDKARDKIAAAGQKRCVQSGYDAESQI